jgi:HSP20 family protein
MLSFWSSTPDPFREMRDLQRRMDRLFGDVLPWLEATPERGPFEASLRDDGDAYALQADLPGMREDGLKIEATRDTLTISGKRTSELPEGYTTHRRERRAVELARSFPLPGKIDPEKVTASLKDGVLTVRMEKRSEEKPRRIEVKPVG